jgi:beta-lactamase regulating signal transducer with metallopeptidase domain
MTSTTSVQQLLLFSREMILGLLLWSCQSLLVLGAAWGALKLDRSRNAGTRCRVWLMALVIVAILPLLNSFAPSLHLPANTVTPLPLERIGPSAVAPAIPPAAAPEFHWFSLAWPVLVAVWTAGVLASLWRLCRSHWELHLVRSRARLASRADLDRLGFREPSSSMDGVRIGLSEEIHSPGLAGIARPWILFPSDIADWTTLEERTSILLHELAHIRRRDYLTVLLQQGLRTIFFFHPLLRHACAQLDMERELACDAHVVGRGAERKVYAESILKVAQRCLPGPRFSAANLFASKPNLERRIDMILDSNRIQPSRKQWLFLMLPAALLLAVTWLVVPASGQRAASIQTASNSTSALPVVKSSTQPGSVPVVDKSTIWTDVVKRDAMMVDVRGLGVMAVGSDGRLYADVKIPSSQARDVAVGLPSNVAIPKVAPTVNGKVIAIHPDTGNGTVGVDVSLDTPLPRGAAAGVSVDGIIQLGILFSVLQVGRPVAGAAGIGEVFRLDEDGQTATRVRVMFGKTSAQSIEIVEGLKAGDRIILSNMEEFSGINKIKLQ